MELAAAEEFRVKLLIWVSNSAILLLSFFNESTREAYWRVARLAEEASAKQAKMALFSNKRRMTKGLVEAAVGSP